MGLMDDYRRLSKGEHCPVCRRKGWCLIRRDETATICGRVESPRRCGKAGWMHPANGCFPGHLINGPLQKGLFHDQA